MNTLLQTLRNLGVFRLAATAGVAVALIVFFIFMSTRLSTPNMALLFGELEPSASSRIITELEKQNVPYQASNDGSRIMVPADQAARLRIALAEQGLTGSVVGYEIFDREQALGTSSFVQNVNHVRALEGELARTVASLAPVQGARVHLVLPRRELFSRERQEPSASIVIKMRGATRLDRNQVLAIQHLVAAAVPGLNPSRISIVDDRGTLLARGGEDPALGQFGGMTPDELRVSFETRLTRTLEELLEPIVGIGNVRAEVRAQMNFNREVIKEETFNPDGQVVRSTQSVEEQNSSTDAAPDAVTVGANLPDAALDAGGGSRTSGVRAEEATNYEISKTVRNLVKQGGRVENLSVAVLVNGTYAESGGQRSYQPRGAEELQKIETLVKSAIGFDEDREDTVQVVNLQFAELPDLVSGDESTTLFGFTPSDLRRLVEVVVLAVVGILIILLVVRPLIAKIFEVTPAAIARATAGGEQRMLTDQMGGMEGLPPGEAGMAPAAQAALQARKPMPVESMIDISQVEGRVKASSLKKIGEIIDKHPEEAVSIIRTWMYQER